MNISAASALSQALILLRAPRSARPAARDRLPDGMLLLLRIVAGEEQAIAQSTHASNVPVEIVREAAAFYIQQVMFSASSDSYRVLGVDEDVGEERIKEHYRWLARWLHPDRNRDPWEAVYAERVSQAWQDVRTPDRRSRYDQRRQEAGEPDTGGPRPPALVVRHAPFRAATPGWSLRWLPAAIFTGLGAFALLTVALFYTLRLADPAPELNLAPAKLASAFRSAVPTPEQKLLHFSDPLSAPPAIVSEPASAPLDPSLQQAELVELEQPEAVAVESRLTTAPRGVAAKGSADLPLAPRQPPPPSLPRAPLTQALAAAPVPTVQLAAAQTTESARDVANAASSGKTTLPVAVVTSAPGPDNRVANRLLAQFSQAYSDGSIVSMRALMTADVQGPRGGLDTILSEYGVLFGGSTERSLSVRNVSWFASGDTLTIIASYDAAVVAASSGRPRRTQGDLRLDARREGQQWRIFRLRHGQRGG